MIELCKEEGVPIQNILSVQAVFYQTFNTSSDTWSGQRGHRHPKNWNMGWHHL